MYDFAGFLELWFLSNSFYNSNNQTNLPANPNAAGFWDVICGEKVSIAGWLGENEKMCMLSGDLMITDTNP